MSVSSSRRSSLETSENLQLAPVELDTDNKIHLEPIDEETRSHGKVCSYYMFKIMSLRACSASDSLGEDYCSPGGHRD